MKLLVAVMIVCFSSGTNLWIQLDFSESLALCSSVCMFTESVLVSDAKQVKTVFMMMLWFLDPSAPQSEGMNQEKQLTLAK